MNLSEMSGTIWRAEGVVFVMSSSSSSLLLQVLSEVFPRRWRLLSAYIVSPDTLLRQVVSCGASSNLLFVSHVETLLLFCRRVNYSNSCHDCDNPPSLSRILVCGIPGWAEGQITHS